MGVTNLEKAYVVEWCTWLLGTLHATGFRAFWRPDKFVGDNKAAYDAIVAKGREKIGECFERIETRVKGRQHAVGEDFTIVDFYLYLFWHWGIAAEFDIMGDYTGYRNVLLQIEALQGVRNAMHQNGFEVCLGNNQASR
jgi:glutathione S-transferase